MSLVRPHLLDVTVSASQTPSPLPLPSSVTARPPGGVPLALHIIHESWIGNNYFAIELENVNI